MEPESPFSTPNPSHYMQLVSQHLSLRDFELEEIWSLSPQAATRVIVTIAQKLQAYPRLLHGANCLIAPRFKVHCSTTSSEVKHFLIADQETHHCEIYSFTAQGITPSLSRKDIQQLLLKSEKWDQEFGSSSDNDWLGCVAQVLQEMLDDPRTDRSFQLIARTHLNRFGKAGILPPSMFVHFVDANIPHFESMREFSAIGGFCDAHKITVDGTPICFRVLRQWETSDSQKLIYKQFCRELTVWHQLRHPNILPLIGASTEVFRGRYSFLVPWLSNGSLPSYLQTHPKHDKCLAVTQIVNGLDYLHNFIPPVGHKDLKGDNILVGSDLVCVITDFGLASMLDPQRSTTLGRGSHYWRAPELGWEEVPNQDSRPRDIYSLGSTIAEILIEAAPISIWVSIMRGNEPILPPARTPDWPPEERQLWRLAKACLARDPKRRPLISDIKRYIQDGFVQTESSLGRNYYISTEQALCHEQGGLSKNILGIYNAVEPQIPLPMDGDSPLDSAGSKRGFFSQADAHLNSLPKLLKSWLPSRRSPHDSPTTGGTSIPNCISIPLFRRKAAIS